ncbi:MAG: LUD domain-containing protein [Gammaproteobacteria bacterium]
MADDRATIFAGVRHALDGRARAPRPSLPEQPATGRPAPGRTGGEAFLDSFRKAGGVVLDDGPSLGRWLAEQGEGAVYCDPAIASALVKPLEAAGLPVCTLFPRDDPDRVFAAITPATAAIAETGTLVLTDGETRDRLAAVATWVHVAVLDPGDVLPGLAASLAALPDDPNVVYVTGPSQTADVEGILIRGVHGPGVQACLPLAWRPEGDES